MELRRENYSQLVKDKLLELQHLTLVKAVQNLVGMLGFWHRHIITSLSLFVDPIY